MKTSKILIVLGIALFFGSFAHASDNGISLSIKYGKESINYHKSSSSKHYPSNHRYPGQSRYYKYRPTYSPQPTYFLQPSRNNHQKSCHCAYSHSSHCRCHSCGYYKTIKITIGTTKVFSHYISEFSHYKYEWKQVRVQSYDCSDNFSYEWKKANVPQYRKIAQYKYIPQYSYKQQWFSIRPKRCNCR